MELIRAKKVQLSLDMAPLIDVVFQLLVFFMLTSSFAYPSMKLILPQAATDETVSRQQVVISIDQAGEIFINDRKSSLEIFASDLRKELRAKKIEEVFIRGDQDMPYRHFIEIMDLAKQAGAKQINILHQPREE
jgi:biopolymer transport protein ExbD